MASVCITSLGLDTESKSYSQRVEELKTWTELRDVTKEKKCLGLALSLPDKDGSKNGN